MNKQQELPLVSVIITTYNRSIYLEETLHSIANQTYVQVEILVIDDGSKPKIASENQIICSQFKNCTYAFKENTGQPDSRNYGIHKAKGMYIAFCDDDDFWLLDKLEKQVAILNTHPEIGLVTGNIEFVNADGVRSGRVIGQTGNHGYVFKEFLLKNRTTSITPVLRKSVFDKVGYFNPDFTIFEDWEYWRRVAFYYPFYALQDVLACVRKHDSNITHTSTTDPYEQYMRYRELTKTLLVWGEQRFLKQDKQLITSIEAARYKQILRNHCLGLNQKLRLLNKITRNSVSDGFYFVYLFLKY
ncbi:glycosyltransferase [Lacinutrix sp. WUR7]|uniref:glycosyltransferase family 2 protein n=1 Tax=Lacinutrix sp. WUR7 TaxID=2653681 RepID=UPI00193DFFF2|nr:glycosyltransferase [Lacinutrix sp. WUR7]QRM87792.1 glycosyltransferase [Lacinutrix sp. WUR7]